MTAQRRQIREFQFSGVNKDLPPNRLPDDLYSDVVNMEAFDIGMRTSLGTAAAFGTPLFDPEYLVFIKESGQFFWIYASSDGLGVTDGELHFDITPAAPITSTWLANWTHGDLNGLAVFNNSIDAPFYWNNITAEIAKPLPDWPVGVTVEAMRAYNYNLIGMDVRNGGDFTNQLLWSNSADPGVIPDSWTPLPENDAGFNTLSDQPGALVDGQQFRDTFMLFKEHSTYLMNFIGGNSVFAFRKLFTTSGILTQNCAAEYLGNVAVLTDGDFIITDGQRADSLIDKKMRTFLFNQIDSENFRAAYVVAYHAANQIWCCFPQTGSDEATLALVYDATNGKFGIRELSPKAAHITRGQVGNVTGVISWDLDPGEWDLDITRWKQNLFNPTEDALLQADRTGTVLIAIGEGSTYTGTPIRSRVERSGLDFGAVEQIKFVKSVVPRITGTPGTKIQVRLGAAANDANIVLWQPPIEYIIGEGESGQKVDVFVTGRFIAISFESELDQAPWIVQGVLFEFDFQGRF